MTSKIFTTNIFLTTSRSLIDRLFSSPFVSNFSEIANSLTAIEKEISLIVHPGKNNNFLEMTYEFGSANQSDQSYLTLKFLESNTLFETYFLQNSLENEVSKSTSGNDIYITSKKIYFAFGVGNNLKNWAGPFECSLLRSNFILTEAGQRIITLNMVPIVGAVLRNYFVMNTPLQNRINSTKILNQPYIIEVSEEFKIKDLQGPDSLDEILEKLLTKYIKAITNNSEVLVMLPSIKKNALKYLSDNKYYSLDEPNRNKVLLDLFRSLGLDAEMFVLVDEFDDYPNTLLESYPDRVIDSNAIILTISTRGKTSIQQNTVPDPWNPITVINNKLSKFFEMENSDTKGFLHCVNIEEHLEVRKLWMDYKIISEDKNVFIYGDKRIIHNVLFPGPIITDQTNITLTKKQNNIKNSQYRNKHIEYSKRNSQFQGEFYSDAGGEVDEKYIPKFVFNKQNANVLALNFESNASYLSLFTGSSTLSREDKDILVNARASISEAQNIQKLNSELSKLKPNDKNYGVLEGEKNKAIETIQSLYNKFSSVKDTKITVDIVEQLIQTVKNDPTRFIEIVSNIGAQVASEQLLDVMQRCFTVLSIKTLPAYNISNLGSLGVLVYLDAGNASIVGAKSIQSKSFLSGFYRVQSYKHVINMREAYSEFALLRQFGVVYPEVDPETGRVKIANEVARGIKKP